MRQKIPARLGSIAALLFSSGAILPAWAADPRPHLCQAHETPAFSCATGGKIASLCASTDLSANTGSLTYRFGTRRKIELSYPKKGVRPQAAFKDGVTGGTGGGADYLRFATGAASYVIFSDHYRGHERDGLAVERNGKAIAVLICKDAAMNPEHGWSHIYKAGLPYDKAGFETP